MNRLLRIYKGFDNNFIVKLFDNDIEISNYNNISRVVLDFGSVVVDSDIEPAVFDISTSGISIFLGLSSIDKGRYKAKLITYDSTNQNGIVWDDNVWVDVL